MQYEQKESTKQSQILRTTSTTYADINGQILNIKSAFTAQRNSIKNKKNFWRYTEEPVSTHHIITAC